MNIKKPQCNCDKFFAARGRHSNGCKLTQLDMQLNDFGNFLLLNRAKLTDSNQVAVFVNDYINQLK